MAQDDNLRLTLIEGIVLGLLVQEPSHGFAVAKELGPDGWIGSTFTARRPVVYRALHTLTAKALIVADGAETTSVGPERVIMRPNEVGRTEFWSWLAAPVLHMRDIRVELLVKLALHDRLGLNPASLLHHQYEVLEPIYKSLQKEAGSGGSGFAQTLAWWRIENSESVMRFLERVMNVADS